MIESKSRRAAASNCKSVTGPATSGTRTGKIDCAYFKWDQKVKKWGQILRSLVSLSIYLSIFSGLWTCLSMARLQIEDSIGEFV